MNTHQIAGYIIYLLATFYITVYVGHSFFKSGAVFLVDSFKGDTKLAHVCNVFLLVGYYLLNLGYAAVSINFWNETNSFIQLVEELGFRLGIIITGLAAIHYFNMFTFTHFSKQIQSLYHH